MITQDPRPNGRGFVFENLQTPGEYAIFIDKESNLIHPLGNHVVVIPNQEDARTESGLFIPETTREKTITQTGDVVAVGPGEKDESGEWIPVEIEVGTRVIYNRWSGIEIEDNGTPLLILRETDLIAAIHNPAALGEKNEG